MKNYLTRVERLMNTFTKVDLTQVPHEENADVDKLAKERRPSTKEKEMKPDNLENTWITPIISFLEDGRLLKNINEAIKLKMGVVCFLLLGDTFYKRAFSLPYLKCLSPAKAGT